MAENEDDYELVREVLDVGRAKEIEALAALKRIRQNREWEVKRAINNEREACAKIADGWAACYPKPRCEVGRRVARGIAHDIRELGKTHISPSSGEEEGARG